MDKRENKTRAVPRFSNRSGTTWECPWQQQQQQPQSSRTPPSWWQGANRHGKITARILSPSSPSTLGDSSMATTTQLVVTTRRHFLDPTVDEAQIVTLYLAVTFGTPILEVSYDIPAVIRRYCSVLRQCFPAGMNLCLGLPAGSPCSMNGGCNTTIERLMLSMKPASGGGHDELSLPLVSLMMVRFVSVRTCHNANHPILAMACYLSILYLSLTRPAFIRVVRVFLSILSIMIFPCDVT